MSMDINYYIDSFGSVRCGESFLYDKREYLKIFDEIHLGRDVAVCLTHGDYRGRTLEFKIDDKVIRARC